MGGGTNDMKSITGLGLFVNEFDEVLLSLLREAVGDEKLVCHQCLLSNRREKKTHRSDLEKGL